MAGLTPDFGSLNQSSSAGFANPLATNNVAQVIANVGDTFGIPRVGVSQFLNSGRFVTPQYGQAQADDTPPNGTGPNNFNDVASWGNQMLSNNNGGNNSGGGGGGGGDSQLTQLQKAAASGGLNPSQLNDYNRLMAEQGLGDINGQISDAYQPAINATNDAMRIAKEGATGQESSTLRNYDTGNANIDAESAQLNKDTTNKQTDFNQTVASALEQAIRSFNALKQQGISRFGGSSSAGGALGELASQEFFRQQGQTNTEQTKGNRQFADEFAKIGTYVGQKKTALDNWKLDAMDKIKQNLSETLNVIAARRGDIEANKTKDKIGALQTAKANVDAALTADKQFRQGLALAAITQAQQVAQRSFTPAEKNATLTAFGIPLNGVSDGTTQNSVVPLGPGQRDQFGNLINPTG